MWKVNRDYKYIKWDVGCSIFFDQLKYNIVNEQNLGMQQLNTAITLVFLNQKNSIPEPAFEAPNSGLSF